MTMTNAEKSARYRAKDVPAYRAMKAAYARTPEQRAKRREYSRRWREANREKHNAMARGYHAKHGQKPEYKAKTRERHLLRKFGMTQAAYEALVARQEGRCLICGTDKPNGNGKRLHVDHDHATGRVRGLLCMTCNTYLGWFEANRDAVQAYLGSKL